MRERIRIGVLGAGHMGRLHAGVLRGCEEAELVAIADAAPELAQAAAGQLGCRAAGSLEELRHLGIAAVYVCTPNTTHANLAVAALEAELHVFCEKPLATTLADAARVRRAAMASDRVFQVGFNRRFAPAYARAKELVASGEIVPASLAVKMNRGELRQPAWVANAEVTGGFLYESTIHLLDLIRWLAGEVTAVFARARSSVYPPQLDDFAVTFETSPPPVPAAIAGQRDCGIAGGGKRAVIGTLVSSAHAGWLFPFERLELFGEHATVVTEEMEAITASLGLEAASVATRYTQLPTVERWGYAGETRCFLARAQGRPLEAPDAEDGYRAVELAEAIYRSAASRSEVGLPLVLE